MPPTLHEVLKLSYANRDLQQKGLKHHGYNYDSRFSNDNHQVYYNPNEQKMIFSVTGSHKPLDWIITNPNLALGKLKNTSRYQESDKALKEAKSHFKPQNVTIIGHSLGGTIGSYIAQPLDKVYTLNKGTTLQGYRNNEKAYRTSGDLVSLLGINHKNMTTLENKNLFKNIITNHNIDNIKNEKIFI
jgi:hypothetical protein